MMKVTAPYSSLQLSGFGSKPTDFALERSRVTP
ncbi:hypothetical protein M2307_003417 [Bradyrhizobium japonicum]|nr:hypothetical protein [Bradyrhizobium japonicum]MDH6174448.1 hypothetical protein [Bradyrhizobium japonicum]